MRFLADTQARAVRARLWRRCLVLALSGGLVACVKETALRDEAARVSRAIDQLRDAPNPEKAKRLEALRQAACTHPDTCGLRDQCAQAYAAHISALGHIASAKTNPDVAAQAMALSRAELLLHAALTQTKSCADRQGELIRTHRLGELR